MSGAAAFYAVLFSTVESPSDPPWVDILHLFVLVSMVMLLLFQTHDEAVIGVIVGFILANLLFLPGFLHFWDQFGSGIAIWNIFFVGSLGANVCGGLHAICTGRAVVGLIAISPSVLTVVVYSNISGIY